MGTSSDKAMPVIPTPPSAIAIVRVSGTETSQVLMRLAGELPKPRLAHRVLLRDATNDRRGARRVDARAVG
ncbi:hypothetical protein QA640_11755 [Bradyrhizobium sp. CB82]|uniref:hypothetical protein n=1 Tax=Bradyrhizobium sp. CB82 TaxID=3039159 RepID=UPI0024B186F1|nr:hypothetical protein [Bradyrhizobium sp. CB82]WFU45394.1 hypothetical protein QA640_11755 [Bradyrhizobium sp. CB82]